MVAPDGFLGGPSGSGNLLLFRRRLRRVPSIPLSMTCQSCVLVLERRLRPQVVQHMQRGPALSRHLPRCLVDGSSRGRDVSTQADVLLIILHISTSIIITRTCA